MSLRANAKYDFGLKFIRFMPLNDDLTLPLPVAVDEAGKGSLIGGAGPFDFSDIDSSDDAVPLYSKIDNGDVEENLIDLSGAIDISAVTATELRDAITAAGVTDFTFSLEAVTGRIRAVVASGSYWQLYGECAEKAMFGQGFGIKFVKADTFKSANPSAMRKDSETFTSTDANGKDVEVITDSYRKGGSIAVVDAADDWELQALLEGGVYDETNETFEAPTVDTNKVYFFTELFYSRYTEGTNKEADLVDYILERHRTGVATQGDITRERNFSDMPYTVTTTSFKTGGSIYGDFKKYRKTITEYEALDVENV
jgi:hypothetical protein